MFRQVLCSDHQNLQSKAPGGFFVLGGCLFLGGGYIPSITSSGSDILHCSYSSGQFWTVATVVPRTWREIISRVGRHRILNDRINAPVPGVCLRTRFPPWCMFDNCISCKLEFFFLSASAYQFGILPLFLIYYQHTYSLERVCQMRSKSPAMDCLSGQHMNLAAVRSCPPCLSMLSHSQSVNLYPFLKEQPILDRHWRHYIFSPIVIVHLFEEIWHNLVWLLPPLHCGVCMA